MVIQFKLKTSTQILICQRTLSTASAASSKQSNAQRTIHLGIQTKSFTKKSNRVDVIGTIRLNLMITTFLVLLMTTV